MIDHRNIYGKGELVIGGNVGIAPFVSILCEEKITIGNGTTIAAGVTIVDHDHALEDLDKISEVGIKKAIQIGQQCWIGANAVILKGVTLGDYCVVGAGAVVTKSFPEKSIIVGNPAKLLRRR